MPKYFSVCFFWVVPFSHPWGLWLDPSPFMPPEFGVWSHSQENHTWQPSNEFAPFRNKILCPLAPFYQNRWLLKFQSSDNAEPLPQLPSTPRSFLLDGEVRPPGFWTHWRNIFLRLSSSALCRVEPWHPVGFKWQPAASPRSSALIPTHPELSSLKNLPYSTVFMEKAIEYMWKLIALENCTPCFAS